MAGPRPPPHTCIATLSRLRIVFLLPNATLGPVGGIRVVYEYANRLHALGHEVEVVHPKRWLRSQPRQLVRRSYWRNRRRVLSYDGRPDWFDLDEGVSVTAIPTLDEKYLPPADATFATGWQTAFPVSRARPECGERFQLIQHFETWAGRRRAVERSWQLPLRKVVISQWLLEHARRLGEGSRTTYIPNGMDLDAFFVETPPQDRDPNRVAMLAHKAKWKGTADGLRALTLAREKNPELSAILFSTTFHPRNLPSWIEHRGRLQRDQVRRVYNEASIFLHPSHEEGWPLPPAEAMACGCVLVAADNEGVLDYVTPNETALVVPRGQPGLMADAITRAISDESLRLRLIEAGRRSLSHYTWERATEALERYISEAVGREVSTA